MINDKVKFDVFVQQLNFTRYLDDRIKNINDDRLKKVNVNKIISYFSMNKVNFSFFIDEYNKLSDKELVENLLEIDKYLKQNELRQEEKTMKEITDFIEYLDNKVLNHIDRQEYDCLINDVEKLSIRAKYFIWNMATQENIKYSSIIKNLINQIMLKKCDALVNEDEKINLYLGCCDIFFQRWLEYSMQNSYNGNELIDLTYNIVFKGKLRNTIDFDEKSLIKVSNYKVIEEN